MGPFSLSSFSVYLLSKTFIHLSSQCLVSLCVTAVAYPQSLPFAPHVLWTSSSPPSVTLPLLFPSFIHPPPHPSPTPLCAACCPAAFIYRCTLQCLQHRSTSVCLVQQHHHTSSQAETLLTHKHTYTTTLTLAYEVQRKTMDKGEKKTEQWAYV